MNISFINLDILSLICLIILIISSIIEGFKKELIKLISMILTTLLICILRKQISLILVKAILIDGFEIIKYIIFIILFILISKLFSYIIYKILKKYSKLNVKKVTFKEVILSFLVGTINSLIWINLIICALSLIINIDINSKVVGIFDDINKFLFTKGYLLMHYVGM